MIRTHPIAVIDALPSARSARDWRAIASQVTTDDDTMRAYADAFVVPVAFA